MFTKKEEKILRKVGFTSDQSGLINRYLSENENWEPHLTNCKQFIMNCVDRYQPGRIAVLGSGWWQDLPYEALSEKCEKVIMVDVLHPRQIIHKARKFENIELVRYDITGGLIFAMYHAVREYRSDRNKKDLSQIPTMRFTDHIEADYYVSLNMMDQMDSFIVDYLDRHRIYSEDELVSIRAKIHSQHLHTLPAGRACLISDFQELVTGKNGKTRIKNVIHAELPDARTKKEWIWDFDQAGTYHPGEKTQFKIMALEL